MPVKVAPSPVIDSERMAMARKRQLPSSNSICPIGRPWRTPAVNSNATGGCRPTVPAPATVHVWPGWRTHEVGAAFVITMETDAAPRARPASSTLTAICRAPADPAAYT